MVIRLAPLTITRRWAEWAVGEPAMRGLSESVLSLLTDPVRTEAAEPFARGLAVSAAEAQSREWTPGATMRVGRRAVAVVDAGGLVGISLSFQLQDHGGLIRYHRALTMDEIERSLRTVLACLTRAMFDAEFIGRFGAHGYWLRIGELYRVDPQLPDDGKHPSVISFDGELTVAGADEDAGHVALCQRWAAEVLRSCGLPAWGHGSPAAIE